MHYYSLYRPRELARLQIVLKRIWCWTHDCPLFRLQRRGNVVPAWIVVIALWTTVSLSTASRLSRRLCRRLCLLYCPGVLACFRQGQSTTLFPASHRWTAYVTPKSPKGWLKTRIFTFGIALYFFVTGNRRQFKLNMWVEHSKSHPVEVDDKTSLKWALPRHVTHFKLLVPLKMICNDYFGC